MRKLCLCVMFLASAWDVFGQQSLTITASRSIALQPDEVVFAVNVTSGLNTSLDDVVGALAASGITAVNFLSVFSSTSNQSPVLQWTFHLPAPFSKIKDMINSLTALQQTIARNQSGLSLTFNVQGTQVSPQLQASQQCPIPDLIADVRAQAQKMANTAGVTVGPILALSDGSGATDAPVLVPTVASIAGDFFGFASFLIGTPLPITSPLNCTIIVKFSVLPPQ